MRISFRGVVVAPLLCVFLCSSYRLATELDNAPDWCNWANRVGISFVLVIVYVAIAKWKKNPSFNIGRSSPRVPKARIEKAPDDYFK